MKNIDRRTFFRAVFTGLGSFAISACGKKNVEILDSVYETAKQNQANPFFDDIIISHKPLELTTYHHGEERKITLALIDAVNMLEKSIVMKKILENVDESNYNPLSFSEESENNAINLDYEIVSELVHNYNELEDELNMMALVNG